LRIAIVARQIAKALLYLLGITVFERGTHRPWIPRHRRPRAFGFFEGQTKYEFAILRNFQDKNIHIECCLTSCCKIGGFWNKKWDAHPIKKYSRNTVFRTKNFE